MPGRSETSVIVGDADALMTIIATEKICVPSCFDCQKGATYDRPQISFVSHPRSRPWCGIHSLRASATRSAGRDRPVRLPCHSPLAPRRSDNSLVLLGVHV